MIINSWLPLLRELKTLNVDPILQVFALSHLDLRVGPPAMIVGRFQHAMDTVASVAGIPVAELQKRAVARAATVSSTEDILRALEGLRPILEKLPGVTYVGRVSIRDARRTTAGVRSFASTHGIPVTTGSVPEQHWVRVLRALGDRGVTDALILMLVAHRCRLRLASGESIEPLDEDTLYQTLGAVVGRDPSELKQELFLRMASAGPHSTPDPVAVSRNARALAQGLEGVAGLDEQPREAPASEPAEGEMPTPPWEAFADPPSSMRWRMGAGEDVITEWAPYWETMDTVARRAYIAEHPPPDEWLRWLGLP